jgi:hypothetical protein
VPPEPFGQATTNISGSFIWHLRLAFESALDDLVNKKLHTAAPPRYVSPALVLPCYLVAVAAIECAVNELFLTDSPHLWAVSRPKDFDAAKFERRPPVQKVVTGPMLFFGKSLSSTQSPVVEMDALVGIRNELVHYKFGMTPPAGVGLMAKHGAASVVPPEQEQGGPEPWADRISRLEGILWAHDVACETVRAVIGLAPNQSRLVPFTVNFNVSHQTGLRDHARKRGIEIPMFPFSQAGGSP